MHHILVLCTGNSARSSAGVWRVRYGPRRDDAWDAFRLIQASLPASSAWEVKTETIKAPRRSMQAFFIDSTTWLTYHFLVAGRAHFAYCCMNNSFSGCCNGRIVHTDGLSRRL